jgi:hypothetical protein
LRFEGFCWGYSGEGPRGLEKLLLACGFSYINAKWAAYDTKRKIADGIQWELNHFIPQLPDLKFLK